MVDWTSFPISIIYRVYSYFKKYFDLDKKKNDLDVKEKQLKIWEEELTRLKNISEENSHDYKSMIDFNLHSPYETYIQAGDNVPSPNLEFRFFITNHSLFNLKVKKIHMNLYLENFGELGEINISNVIDLPHQHTHVDRLKYQLHPNTINILKSLKREGKKNLLRLNLQQVRIDFDGDMVFSKDWPYNFILEIAMDRVYVTL
ncbi:MAG: hypothetical protein ABOK23_04370 [Candidatus Methanoperedens sp.]|nr:hypothetical protein [Candidatus Methanoperedens sp.]